jgi:hypothetical protein
VPLRAAIARRTAAGSVLPSCQRPRAIVALRTSVWTLPSCSYCSCTRTTPRARREIVPDARSRPAR